jgi:hypothetical protein
MGVELGTSKKGENKDKELSLSVSEFDRVHPVVYW